MAVGIWWLIFKELNFDIKWYAIQFNAIKQRTRWETYGDGGSHTKRLFPEPDDKWNIEMLEITGHC